MFVIGFNEFALVQNVVLEIKSGHYNCPLPVMLQLNKLIRKEVMHFLI